MREKKSRFIYMVLAGVLITFILDLLVKNELPHDHPRIYDFLITIFITILAWEGNIRIDNWLNNRFPWEASAKKRILLQLPVTVLFSAMAIYLPMRAFDLFVCELPGGKRAMFVVVCLVVGIIISFTILSIEVSTQFFGKWKKSLLEVEKYKAESLAAQLQNLKDQVNPHFMFNNLSVLSSLVYKDQDKAVDFINQLSKVYRYVLDSRNMELVSLEEELTFIKSYTFLLQIRFDKNVEFKIEVGEVDRRLLLPPMALQILVENTIKHNEVSQESPLKVNVFVEQHKLVVKNNLQPRSNVEPGSKTGIKNIEERYRFFTDELVEVDSSNGFFTVKIPLLKTK
ncbi:MAG: sensor histidine kinase [Bacteroidia bacterium]|nr:sensor histidine kinase [Bacteroidia bacterium]